MSLQGRGEFVLFFLHLSSFRQSLKPDLCAAASCLFRLWHMFCSDSLSLQKGWLTSQGGCHVSPAQTWGQARGFGHQTLILSGSLLHQDSSAISRFTVGAKFFHFGSVWSQSLHLIFSLTPGSLTQSRLMIDSSREGVVNSWTPSPELQKRLFHCKHFQSQHLKGTGWTGKALPACWVSRCSFASVPLHLLSYFLR